MDLNNGNAGEQQTLQDTAAESAGVNQNEDIQIGAPDAALGAGNSEPETTPETAENGQETAGKENNDLFGKPETYDFKDIELPEGMTLNKEMTDKFSAYAAKLNLSNKGASNLMAMAAELVKNERENVLNSYVQAHADKIQEYKQLLNTDKEIGGEKLKDTLDTANKAYDAFFKDDELRGVFASAGLNVYPKFIKALKSIGALMQEDKIYSAEAPAEKLSREDILYPSME